MNFNLQVKEALSNLVTSKLRSFLALLGILVGTASVVAMISGGQLATQATLDQIKILGTNLISVSMYGGQSNSNNPGQTPVYLTLDAINNMQTKINTVRLTSPYTQIYLPTRYNSIALNGSILGVTQSLASIVKIKMAQGRFISDLDRYTFNCVLGDQLYQQIYSTTHINLIGKQISMGTQYCTIVGIAAPWPANNFMYTDVNSSLMIPIEASYLLSQYTNISNIVMSVKVNTNFSELTDQVTQYINTHSKNLHLYFRSPEQLLESARKQSDILTVFLGFIGGISLLVGGIGVMNIMLVSVVERKREIGIRMAVGARRHDIQSLFLIESMVLSVCGGIAGVVLGELTSYFIALYKGWSFVFYSTPPVLGFTVSVLIGIFFGFYPAYKASKLNPIDALRSE